MKGLNELWPTKLSEPAAGSALRRLRVISHWSNRPEDRFRARLRLATDDSGDGGRSSLREQQVDRGTAGERTKGAGRARGPGDRHGKLRALLSAPTASPRASAACSAAR